jgi:hypothetical protein
MALKFFEITTYQSVSWRNTILSYHLRIFDVFLQSVSKETLTIFVIF